MVQTQQLIVDGDLGSFFRQEVVDARAQLGVHMDEATEWYVVQLLCEHSHAQSAHKTLTGEPLALLYQRASAAPAGERVDLLRAMGDRALLVAGFFAESVERSLVDVPYYVTMGQKAYTDLAGTLGHGRRAEGASHLYRQLGRGFAAYVDVLNQISSRSRQAQGNDADLLKLYDRWVRTKNDRLKKLLEGRGLAMGERTGGAVH